MLNKSKLVAMNERNIQLRIQFYLTMIAHIVSALLYFLTLCASSNAIKVRIVTWNVADNTRMNGGFLDAAIDNVLGLLDDDELADMYAVGLQENCWKCNEGNLMQIGAKFLQRIDKKKKNEYEVLGVMGTRMSSTCELKCIVNFHGTTAIFVIARKLLSASPQLFRHNDGCSVNFIANKEKGFAAMAVQLTGKKRLCFGAAHLDSSKPQARRDCVSKFYTTADKEVDWSKKCTSQFLFGDFNTRTGDKTDGAVAPKGKYVPKGTEFDDLREKDELAGKTPYGTSSDWNKNLLTHVNEIQKFIAFQNHAKAPEFKECPFTFMPTYSIKNSAKNCAGEFPCYRVDRPMSWTDRIIYTNAKCQAYDAIYAEYGDHFPVYAEFVV